MKIHELIFSAAHPSTFVKNSKAFPGGNFWEGRGVGKGKSHLFLPRSEKGIGLIRESPRGAKNKYKS